MLSPQWQSASPIEVLVSRACETSLPEPRYNTALPTSIKLTKFSHVLHLEVAEYINQKKGNNPRDAAMLIARLACNRNPHVALLALALLDTLVHACGYPFHLQISTKEFLNELVRRFPDRPPPFPGPVMSRILETIQSWKDTICVESRWREDLTNILDMHRLLMHKGYRFRHVPRAAPSASSNANSVAANLKSAAELEAEDREAQSAKLQELIRRGTPKDLLVAQELMKSLAGAEPSKQPDYRGQALSELERLESKVVLLGEMLDNANMEGGERTVPGDVYEQVANILTAARPKIQKWISDAEQGEDDSESLDTLLQLNDQMNTVLGRYDAFKRGDYAAAANPVPSQFAAQAAAAAAPSLIDFDEPSPAATSNATDDLDGLFGLGASSTSTSSPPPINPSTRPMPTNAQIGGAIMLPGTPIPSGANVSPPQQAPVPGYFGQQSQPPMYANGSSMSMNGNGFGGMQPQQQARVQQAASPSPAAAPTTQGKDPFADLAGLF
ncbi:VHS domain-containing protein [Mycena kentingensis (nom. inval.)]|nr:VHS domain-containing protein [Mycena kentingensis (nom. inval.)]